MNFDQIQCFMAAARCSTFMEAADTLHTTQSSLSKQIQKLEKELNLSLFDRSRRKAVLTPAGQVFYRESQSLMEQYRHMMEAMKTCRADTKRTLRIGALPVLSQYDLPRPLKDFQSHGEVGSILLDEGEEQELLEGLETGKYDMIIAREQLVEGKTFQKHILAKDELAAILPASHKLARASAVSLNQLAGESFILMKTYTSVYQQCIAAFKAKGLNPHILRTARLETIISAVAEGEGISLVPKSNLKVFLHQGIAAASLEPSVPLNVVLAWKNNPDQSFLQKEFIRYIKAVFPAS